MRATAITHPASGRGVARLARSRTDPAPWSTSQGHALTRAVARECGWGLRHVQREVAGWRARAARIPHPEPRANALQALARKRSYLDGAALFWTLPGRRDPRLLSLLVSFQVAADFLDQASERGVAARGHSGGSLMPAFADAVDLSATPTMTYYDDHPWVDDGGYLRDLVTASRRGCATLPGYGASRALLLNEAQRARALELVHEPDPQRRDDRLRRLDGPDAADDPWWFEKAAGSASALSVIALLALAADPRTTDDDRRAAALAYRWVGALSTMLDSYVDQEEDRASGEWSAVARYPDPDVAAARLAILVDRALREVGDLRHGERHVVLVSSMVALFLSRNSARSQPLADSTERLIAAGGSLTRSLVPVLRLWRTAYGQRTA